MDIGKQIEERRKELRYSRKSLAEKIGVTEQTIFNVEKGKPVTMTVVKKLCQELNLDIQITKKQQ